MRNQNDNCKNIESQVNGMDAVTDNNCLINFQRRSYQCFTKGFVLDEIMVNLKI